jgi:hypothetical protein
MKISTTNILIYLTSGRARVNEANNVLLQVAMLDKFCISELFFFLNIIMLLTV